MKEVSLYIPCFNVAKTIQHCLEAVFKQTYPLKEVLIVDDGSIDETTAVVSRYPVKVIKHMSNRGLAAARNTALKNINTEFIASMDADCVPESDWLKNLMKRFNSSKIAGIGGRLLETYSSTLFDVWRSVHMKQYWSNNENSPLFLFGSNCVYRKESIMKVGLYNEDYKSNYEDVDLCERLKKKGYVFRYESKAIAHHLKKDDLCSILNDYWKWNAAYYKKKNYYANQKKLIFKIKDNLGLVNRYIEDDITHKRHQLVYLDFLLGLHHSLRDFEFFISSSDYKSSAVTDKSVLLFWLNLLDLTFFYHLGLSKDNLSTLIPKANTFLQNLFALNLILGRTIQDKFQNKHFHRLLYKHLFLSVYKIDISFLLDSLSNLVELHRDWSGLVKKSHPNLCTPLLENLSLNFKKWLEKWMDRFPDIIKIIEISAEKTDSFVFKKEGL